MADDADIATEQAALFQDVLVQRIKSRPKGRGPILIDGVQCCRNCEEPMDPKRLKILPDAEYCVECAEELSANNQRNGVNSEHILL